VSYLIRLACAILHTCACVANCTAQQITPFKYTSAPETYQPPASSVFQLSRAERGAPPITYYISKPERESFPIIVLCGGSSTKEGVKSVIHLHRYFLEESLALGAALMTVEQRGVSWGAIDSDEWFAHYTRSNRLADHQNVLDHLCERPVAGWDGRLIFLGISEGGALVNSLTDLYENRTLATINWSGAGDFGWEDELWTFSRALLKSNPLCPHGTLLSKCVACGETVALLSSKERYLEQLKLMKNSPITLQSFLGMSYLYHADALSYPAPNYSKFTAPYLVVSGVKDPLIGSYDCFVKKAKEAGVPVTYFRIEDMDHYVRKRPDVIKRSFDWLRDVMPFSKPNVSKVEFCGMTKEETINFLKTTPEAELWDLFLSGQAQMLAPANLEQMKASGVWGGAKRVLEIGCGSGDFLAMVQRMSPEKFYAGFDIEQGSIERAKKRFSAYGIDFSVGDAGVYQPKLEGAFDLVIFRYTLQHLSNPEGGLEIAYRYLKPGGHIYIMDAYDPANGCSHPLSAVKEALERVASKQGGSSSLGNRYASLKVLKGIKDQSSSLSKLYQVFRSNLDTGGVLAGPELPISGRDASDLLRRHLLLFGALVGKKYGVVVDLDKHYSEVSDLCDDLDGWFTFGMHHLVLKKVSSQY